MKWTVSFLACIASFTSTLTADVITLQGSSRWRSTLLETGLTTTVGTTSYITYTLIERSQGAVVNQWKIDAWSARNPQTGRTERWYYIDRGFRIEFGNFGRFGTDVGGGMQFTGVDATIPFRGTSQVGTLTAFRQFPVTDYLPTQRGVDLMEISGSGRLNRSFTGNFTLTAATNAIQLLLESRGYREAL
jgi:hypothetical protein